MHLQQVSGEFEKNMKKVFVVSKTHLDLGFTDYAGNIKQKYLNTFIPDAISLAEKVNKPDKKYFVWTTGSWLLKEMLQKADDMHKEKLINAIKNGNIAPHAMPFTTHSELLDYDTFDYGLSIVDELDKIRGRKTIAAKMTDVPGHTKGIVNLLAKRGIKLLHIGVNGASAVPQVPECFLWKCGNDEIIVIYSGDYGGAFKSDFMDEVLYFDHTLDNHGAPSPEKVMNKFNKIQSQFPDYEVTAGTMDDFADVIWQYKDKLPVYEGEIGDTWIHGAATDPYKSASLRELMRLKREWLNDGSMQRYSEEYIGFSDALICIAEHTCGMDSKMHFADYDHYLKKDFKAARSADKVKIKHLFRGFPHNFIVAFNRMFGSYQPGSYKNIEKSWQEQRDYIDLALSHLSDEHKAAADKALSALIPAAPMQLPEGISEFETVECSGWKFKLNKKGGIGYLAFGDDEIIRENDEPVMEYFSFSDDDYNYWLNHYSRNLEQTAVWAIPDFARPMLKYENDKYPAGRFEYFADRAVRDGNQVIVHLKCEKRLCEELGAPRLIQIIYTLNENGVKIDVSWFGKDANRLTEAVYMHLFPSNNNINLIKISDEIDPKSVASKGGRNLHAVFGTELACDNRNYRIINHHSPLVSIGRGKILQFDNKFESAETDGITYVLYNNVWGTNFPLWYEDNARFLFEISK